MSFHHVKAGILAGARPLLTLTDSVVSSSDLTTYTFSSRAFGAAHPARRVIAAITIRSTGSTTISSVTIGGVSASEIATATNTTSGNTTRVALYIATVPTGTTGDVVVTNSAGALRCAVSIYRLLGAAASAFHTLVASSSSNLSAPTGSLNIPGRGCAVGVSFNTAGSGASWTGLTEDTDTVIESPSIYSSAHSTEMATQTGRTVTCDWGSSGQAALVAASFATA